MVELSVALVKEARGEEGLVADKPKYVRGDDTMGGGDGFETIGTLLSIDYKTRCFLVDLLVRGLDYRQSA